MATPAWRISGDYFEACSCEAGGPMAALEPLVRNAGHPAASRLALARASRGHMRACGIDWDGAPGRNNGHSAPFARSSA